MSYSFRNMILARLTHFLEFSEQTENSWDFSSPPQREQQRLTSGSEGVDSAADWAQDAGGTDERDPAVSGSEKQVEQKGMDLCLELDSNLGSSGTRSKERTTALLIRCW